MRMIPTAVIALAAACVAPTLASAQVQCLIPTDPSVCNPAWVPDPVQWPGHEGLARVTAASTSTVQVAGSQWHVRLDLVTNDHPGLVQIYLEGAPAITSWSTGATKEVTFVAPLGGAIIHIEWVVDGVVNRRSLYLRRAGAMPGPERGIHGPWWNWSAGQGSRWPGEEPIW